MTDPIDCNAWNIYFNLTMTLDYTNGTAVNIGLRGPFIRALFHDAGTYNPADGSGGMDGSLIHELTDRKDNLGLEKTAQWVEELFSSQKAECSWLSRADIISMGAFIAMSSPNYTTPYYTGNSLAVTPIALPFLIGRVDTNTANPTGRLPAANQSATDVLTRFTNDFGFTVEEAAAIVSASHSVGGINIGGRHTDPPVGTQYQTFFLGTIDGPKAIVDNKAINRAIGGIALIPADNQMAKLSATSSFMSNFNANLTALYAAYYPAALKMSLLGQNANAMRTWTPPLPL
ncbi:heme peroxidase [Gonapodya prolifera JEL478]|uniref:Peroxidase n=1 Tax=Gonapodya prolifera (strain JEL478) TaxID=1344416 RepID=A0A139ATA7_GONPJ|nr:heme peroxidase [Gonapodya prolifera JEL478]|eukprot:KXS19924.1 heme peroxidase [Gonapodya prolifera JEL478]